MQVTALAGAAFQAGHLADGRVSILRGAVFPTTDGTDSGEEHAMNTTAEISEPANELERLIADLSGSGLLVFVFGDGLSKPRTSRA